MSFDFFATLKTVSERSEYSLFYRGQTPKDMNLASKQFYRSTEDVKQVENLLVPSSFSLLLQVFVSLSNIAHF